MALMLPTEPSHEIVLPNTFQAMPGEQAAAVA
jgi:hypothetical protein